MPRTIPLRYDEQRIQEQPWLQDAEQYAYLRKLAQEGKIAAVTLDALDESRCRALSQAIHDAQMRVAVVYASNIGSFVYPHAALVRPSGEQAPLKTDFYGQTKTPDAGVRFQHNLGVLADPESLTFDLGSHKNWRLVIAGTNDTHKRAR